MKNLLFKFLFDVFVILCLPFFNTFSHHHLIRVLWKRKTVTISVAVGFREYQKTFPGRVVEWYITWKKIFCLDCNDIFEKSKVEINFSLKFEKFRIFIHSQNSTFHKKKQNWSLKKLPSIIPGNKPMILS